MCNLSTLPALLTSPMFCSTAASLASVLEQVSTALRACSLHLMPGTLLSVHVSASKLVTGSAVWA